MTLVARVWPFRCRKAIAGRASVRREMPNKIVDHGALIAEKLGVSQPTASEHLKISLRAGLVRARRIKQWTFYKRDETSIKKVKRMLVERV
jgi:DNA-binding transcriptional ArsR family regulator